MDPCFVSLPTKGAWKRWKPLIYDTKPAIKIVLYSKMLEQHKTMRELFPRLTSWCITAEGHWNETVIICFSWCCMQICMMKQSRPRALDTHGLCAEHAKQWRELIKYYKQTVTSEERDLTRQTCYVYSIPCHALRPWWPQHIKGGGRSVHGEHFCCTEAMKRAAELKDFADYPFT